MMTARARADRACGYPLESAGEDVIMRRLALLFPLGFLLACSDGTAPTSLDSVGELQFGASRTSGQIKVKVCHRKADGSFKLINIGAPALDAHLAHGDAAPGDPVPGMAGYVFDDACVPELPPLVAPVISDLQPPDETPTFVWNPDLGVDYSYRPTDLTRLCPSTEPFDCESLMFEAVDLGTGVEDGSCGTECADDDFDGNLIDVVILDSPGDVYNGASLLTNNAGLGPDMFQAFFCGDNFAPPNGGAMCDGSDDGTYAVRILASDKTQPENNVATLDYSFVLDTNPPVIGFGGITGLNASNAATVEFILDANVTDRNGDGTAVSSAIVQVTIEPGIDFVCGLGATFDEYQSVLITPPNNPAPTDLVIVDVTSQVNANGGDFSVTFTATNQDGNLGLGSYTYCFTITADDGAERKDGSDDWLAISSVAGKSFTWQ
jgi:hypothetical protein